MCVVFHVVQGQHFFCHPVHITVHLKLIFILECTTHTSTVTFLPIYVFLHWSLAATSSSFEHVLLHFLGTEIGGLNFLQKSTKNRKIVHLLENTLPCSADSIFRGFKSQRAVSCHIDVQPSTISDSDIRHRTSYFCFPRDLICASHSGPYSQIFLGVS